MPSHIQSTISDEKALQLRRIIERGGTVDCAQVFEVRWPEPTGTKYYAKTRYDLAPNFANIPWKPIEYGIVNNGGDRNVSPIPINITYEVGNDTINLEFIDHDQAIRELFVRHPEGAQIHVWLYIPQIDWSGEIWWGLLDPPGTIEDGILRTTASFGTRSPLALLPGRVMSLTRCHAAPFFGGKLKTQKEIDRGGCPYNAHIGGSVGNLDSSGKFYGECDGSSDDVCLARIGGDKRELPILRFASIIGTESVAQTKGGNTQSTTRGNESALNVPCPVVIGERTLRELPPLTFQIQRNNKHPEKGTVSAIFPVSDSGVVSLSEPAINDTPVVNSPGTSQNQFLSNLGKPRQRSLNLTGQQIAANYSNVAHWRGLIFGNFAGQTAGSFKGKIKCVGDNEILRWTGTEKGTRGYSFNRAEAIYEALTNVRWGLGEPEEIYLPLDWETAAADCAELAGYADASGGYYQSARSTIHAQLEGRRADEQIRELCLAGFLTAPFPYQGKKRVFVLKKEPIDSSIPVFSDSGVFPNIQAGRGGARSIRIEQKKPYELYNLIKVWFEDAAYEYVRRPLIFTYDNLIDARRAIGATPLNPFEQTLLGVVEFGEAVRAGQMIGDLGPFCSGGVKNNLRVSFTARSTDPEVLGLHPYKLIKVASRDLAPYREESGRPLEYFRVLNLNHQSDWHTQITAQAWPVDYIERMEDATQPPPKKGSDGTGALPIVDI